MGKLTPDELVKLAPEIIAVVKEVASALKKNEGDDVRVTRAEARALRASVFRLAALIAKESLD
jgi:hypothetical protein